MYIRNRRKTTQWNLFSRFSGMALMMVVGVISAPLYLKFIPLNLYGAWLASGNMLAWLSTIDPGLTSVLQQQVAIAYGKQDFQAIRSLLGGGLLIGVIVLILAIVFGLVCAHYLPTWLNLSSTIDVSLIVRAFSLAVIGTSLMLFSFAIVSISQGLQGSLGVGLINNGTIIISFILTIILLNKGFGLFAIAIGLVFSGVCHTLGQGIYLIWRLISEKIGFSFSFTSVISLMKLLSYTLLGRASGIVANNVDLIIVSRFLGPEVVAILSLTRKPIDLSKGFVDQPVVAFMPAVSHLAGSGEIDKARNILMRLVKILLWVLCLVIGGFIALNDDFIRLWVGQHLFAGATINLILCLSLFFTVTTISISYICFALGNIKGNSLAALVQSILFIPLVIFGTKYFGLLGAVLAPLIAAWAVSVWYYPWVFSRLLKLSSQDRQNIISEVFSTLAVMIPVTLGFSWFHPGNWFQFIALVALFLSLYGGLIYLVSKDLRGEIKRVTQELQKAAAITNN
jgi:O-antigen/teichoic acid export membrane protein